MADLDFRRIGLKVGLEIHQQLNTHTKLFCGCSTRLFKEEPEFTFLRKLRPTQSELGQIDPAALFEFQKGIQIQYEADTDTACLVEMDEEPPHHLNPDALRTTLIIAILLNAKPVNEIHVMRKTVIDGSNTTGFQRTCAVAFDGKLAVRENIIPIEHVSLEEDAARKMSQDGNTLEYRVDRLCIPLVEIATAPTIKSPNQAKEVALIVGQILRTTGMVKRGLGSIRQDLNISIRDGAIVEIKGVQELELVATVVENEVKRQKGLLEISQELVMRGVSKTDITNKFVDVTQSFHSTKCKVIHQAIKRGEKVFAVKLPSFNNLLGRKLGLNMRLGAELADRARFWGRVGGIFHTDELPGYGISGMEVESLRATLKAKDDDAIVFAADTEEKAKDALRAVTTRAKEALDGVPKETRAVRADGSTYYMRPRPGAARMYPETDVPPIQVNKSYVENLHKSLPELPESKKKRFIRDYKLNQKLSNQLLNSEFEDLFEEIIKKSNVPPMTVAVTFTETLRALKRDGVQVYNVSNTQFTELFHLVGLEEIMKEAIPDIITWLSTHKESKLTDAVKALDLMMFSKKELEGIVKSILEENKDLLAESNEKTFRILLGLIMKEVRGRAKPESVLEIIKAKLRKTS